tara:strand:+ start:12871 stop:14142 length:1272 start_codon:yes stop_codon:yes gene_type:complete
MKIINILNNSVDMKENLLEREMLNSELNSLNSELTEELEVLLSFWSTKTIDSLNEGFIGEIDHFGNKNNFSSKGAVLNTRILWTFSCAFRVTKNPAYKVIAEKQFKYIIAHFWDTMHGGLFWELDNTGNPINTRKQAYAQGFGIYAFSEFYRATGDNESLKHAKELYHILENKFYDKNQIGYIEALKEDWSVIEDMRLSDKDLNAPKSMNTHLHILEAYTNLFRVWEDETLKQNIVNLISVFQDKIIDKKTGHFCLFFDMDWTKRSTAISFGHDIEGAWLLHESAQVIDDEVLIKDVQVSALSLVDLTLLKGLDKDGSLFYELENNHYDKDKHWWSQAEAMVGLMDAYQINSNPIYLKHLFNIWKFIKIRIIDKENGEWHWRVDENGATYTDDVKVGFWKCPYHNGRALMELIERIEKINYVG